MELTKNSKILLGVLAATAVGAGAWYGLMGTKPDTPTPLPAQAAKPIPPAAAPAMDKTALMSALIRTTRIEEALGRVPEQIQAGMAQSAQASNRKLPEFERFRQAMAESFTAEGFRTRFHAELEAKFDATHAQAVVNTFSQPTHQRLLQLEMVDADRATLMNFAAQLASKPLPDARKALIQRLDAATGASQLAAEATFAAMKSMLATSGQVPAGEMQAIDAKLAQLRPAITEQLRESTLISFAYVYRDVSDSDLESYLKAYEAPSGRWYSGIVGNTVLGELTAGSEHLGARLAELLPKKSRTEAPANPEPARHAATTGAPRHWHKDARVCLDQTDRTAVIRCANKFY